MSANLLHMQMRSVGLEPETEFRFHSSRRWRSDFAFPEAKILIEYEGGIWGYGRHNRASGFERDCEKYSTAAAMGYRVLRFTVGQVKRGLALALIQQALDEPA